MRRLSLLLMLVAGMSIMPPYADAQLIRKAEMLLQTAFADSRRDSAEMVADRAVADSVRLRDMELRLQEMEMTEMMLRARLDSALESDSHAAAEQMRRIDSLRTVTSGEAVVVDGDTLFALYAERGGYSARARAAMVSENLERIGSVGLSDRDSVYMLDFDDYTDIMCGERVVMTVTDRDAMWEGVTRHELASRYLPVLSRKIDELREGYNFWEIVKRAGLFILVVVAQYMLFKFTNYLFRRLRRQIIRFRQQRLRPVIIRDYELLNTRRLGRMLIFLSNLLRYFVLLVQLMFSVPVMFAIFPQTEKLAVTIFMYIIEPVKMVVKSIVEYIPNLFIILVIWYCIKYIIRGIRYIASEIENDKLRINGFYPDWARPTFNIIRFLLYAFMIAMVYPYLPGSDSGVFQGISVFVGLIVSLGSSTVIGNIIAGLVITYMRPFKIGDRIKLDQTTGNVIEKTPFVTRLRTPKNEVVTIPNSFIMSSHTVNYSASARQYGLIIHTTVSIGYDVPWRQVHQLLINAARMTEGVLEDPRPFVLETELQDYYPCYQINAYIRDADIIGDIMSDLHRNIQDVFNEAGVEIMSPHYYAERDGSASTIPADYLAGK